jgi:hypothetical protein
MKELDLLKDWQKNKDSFEQVSEIEIYRMIHKKSSSIVKWILIISIWRFCCGPFKYDFNADDYLENINNNGFALICY